MSMNSCLHRSGLGRLAVPELGRAGPKPSNCPKNGPQLSALGKKQASLNPPRNQKSPQNTNIGHFRTLFQKYWRFGPKGFRLDPAEKSRPGGAAEAAAALGQNQSWLHQPSLKTLFFKKNGIGHFDVRAAGSFRCDLDSAQLSPSVVQSWRFRCVLGGRVPR